MRIARHLIPALSILSGALLPCSAVAQSYGQGDQVATVGASAFRGQTGPGFINPADGYLYVNNASHAVFFAPFDLPDGAEITQLCFYARNEDPSLTVAAELDAVKLAPGGLSPGVVTIPGSLIVADFHFGYGVVCTDPISYTVHDAADVDNDGTVELVAHRLALYFENAASGVVGAGGVRITWHRQVSPPPASATFGDVPTSHPFFLFVEALAASGVTGGCGGGNYCPDNPITRGQRLGFGRGQMVFRRDRWRIGKQAQTQVLLVP